MKVVRAILSGSLAWLLVLSTFTAMSFIPGMKDSELQQGWVIGFFIIPFASLGAAIYYKNGDKTNGLLIGLIMVTTALLLDVCITVPLVEIPYNGSSYSKFFTNPLLWVLVAENVAVIYLYWKWKVKTPTGRHKFANSPR
jgi:hypothetical protein